MHYPVMTEKHVADRWQVSLKTLRRWRLDGEGPVWHKLFRHVRYHEADILEFERRGAQHLMTLLGVHWEFKPADEDAGEAFDAQGSRYLTAKDIAEAASLPPPRKIQPRQSHPRPPNTGTNWSRSKTENGSIPRSSLNRSPKF